MPGLVEADDLGMYVVKMRGAGQGLKVLVAEVIVGEIARLLGPVFPDHRDALETAARSFDRVRYGREHVGPDVAGSVLDLDARLSRTRPELPRETP